LRAINPALFNALSCKDLRCDYTSTVRDESSSERILVRLWNAPSSLVETLQLCPTNNLLRPIENDQSSCKRICSQRHVRYETGLAGWYPGSCLPKRAREKPR